MPETPSLISLSNIERLWFTPGAWCYLSKLLCVQPFTFFSFSASSTITAEESWLAFFILLCIGMRAFCGCFGLRDLRDLLREADRLCLEFLEFCLSGDKLLMCLRWSFILYFSSFTSWIRTFLNSEGLIYGSFFEPARVFPACETFLIELIG